MTKRDLVVRISRETGLTQIAVKEVVQKFLDYIIESLEGRDNVELRNFGVFFVKHRDARIGRNPNKPEEVVRIPEREVPDFKPGKIMKEKVQRIRVSPEM